MLKWALRVVVGCIRAGALMKKYQKSPKWVEDWCVRAITNNAILSVLILVSAFEAFLNPLHFFTKSFPVLISSPSFCACHNFHCIFAEFATALVGLVSTLQSVDHSFILGKLQGLWAYSLFYAISTDEATSVLFPMQFVWEIFSFALNRNYSKLKYKSLRSN